MQKKVCDMIIENCCLLDKDYETLESQSIVIEGDKIEDFGNSLKISKEYSGKEVVDGKNKLFMPGLVDAHTHTCQQLLRAKIIDQYPMIWKRIMVPFESNLNSKDIDISSKLSCLEMIKSGTTTFLDAGGIHMNMVAKNVIESGLRAGLTCSTMDSDSSLPPNMVSTEEEALEKNRSLFKEFDGAGDDRLKVWFSLRTLLSCSESLIVKFFEEARSLGTGVQAHMNEYPGEINFSLENHQKRPIEYLDSLGVLGPDFLSAHSILISENEIDILRDRGSKVVHCPISNLGKGFHKTPRLIQSKIPVGLGSDGTAHAGLSLFNEVKAFRSAMSASQGVPISDPAVMPAKTLLEIITLGGAKAVMRDGETGTIEVGKKADLISIDINQPHIMPTHDLSNTVVEVVNSSDVRDMIVDGKLIMKNREVLTLDEEKILFESSVALKDIKARAGI